MKLGSTLFKYFLIINDLYNGAKIVNLPRVVVENIFFNIKRLLPVWTGNRNKSQIWVTFCIFFLIINDLYNGAKFVNLPLVVVEI